jgi:hypothetical protein
MGAFLLEVLAAAVVALLQLLVAQLVRAFVGRVAPV